MPAESNRDPKEVWRKIVDSLHVSHIRGTPAINKPLVFLMILSRAQRGCENRFSFPELTGEIRDALIRFGPKRKTVSPALGFWHLRNDGFWIIHGLDRAPTDRNRRGPTISALRNRDVYATVRDDLWAELVQCPGFLQELAKKTIQRFLSSQSQDDVAAFFGLSVE